ncbi:MAG TPA: family 16 glycosylhydrolase [Polyangiaceae bacterium]
MLKVWPRAAFALAAFAATAGVVKSARAVASAELYTLASYRYGRFRARVQFPPGDGVVGSFFLWKDGSDLANTFWNELDYEKIDADCEMQLNSFFGLPKVEHANIASGLTALCTGYHTYSYEWTPDHVSWLVDDVEVRRDTDANAQAFADQATQGMQFRFNLWPGTGFGGTFSPSILPVQQFISWVEYSAYTPGNGEAGGDFTLAWRESFEQGIPSGWAEGNWASALGQSTHSTFNVTVANGVAVLSLTADNALGFAGVPPVDVGELPSARGPGDAGVGDSGPRDASADRVDANAVDGGAADASLSLDGANVEDANDATAAPLVDAATTPEAASSSDGEVDAPAADAFSDVTNEAAVDYASLVDATLVDDALPGANDASTAVDGFDAFAPADVSVAVDSNSPNADGSVDASSDATTDAAQSAPTDRAHPDDGCSVAIGGGSKSDAITVVLGAALAIARIRRRRA